LAAKCFGFWAKWPGRCAASNTLAAWVRSFAGSGAEKPGAIGQNTGFFCRMIHHAPLFC
jgi:hypothetical protein